MLASGCTRSLQVLVPGADGSLPDGGGADGGGDGGLDAGPAPPGLSAIASSGSHVCRLDLGALFCWGNNASGQLGDGTRNNSLVPLRIGQRSDFVDVGIGEGFSCALDRAGTLACWGENARGQLGQGDVVDRLDITPVPGGPWDRFDAGQEHVCAIDSSGALYCWGNNYEGQIGLGDPFGSDDIAVPTEVTPGERYLDVAAGDGHSCAIRIDGAVYCWGRNTQAQLGLGMGSGAQIRAPTLVDPGPYARIDVTQHHGCAIRADGALFCWGEDTHGELGQGLAVGSDMVFHVPTQVGTRTDYEDVSVHWFNTCAISTSGELSCCGRGIEGQLGQGDINPSGVLLTVPYATPFDRAAVGRFHVCAQSGDTGAICWGANADGQLGAGDTMRRNTPTATTP
ncbi:MAG: RCC1 domain-containing protein [Sandaracinaceae bacterium]